VKVARKLNVISITAPKIRTYRSEDESEPCHALGACEVFRNSPQSIRLYTTTSIIKGISIAGPDLNHCVTLLFSNGAKLSLPETCSSAKNGDWFEFV
jgi:hypothetical protein